jgi:hypothetical protein
MRRIGMVSKVSIGKVLREINIDVSISSRCTARPTNFDDDATSIPRSHDHTRALLDAFGNDPKILWDGYGIISDVMVCPHDDMLPFAHADQMITSRLRHCFRAPTYTNSFRPIFCIRS